jgi:hypothetical protein
VLAKLNFVGQHNVMNCNATGVVFFCLSLLGILRAPAEAESPPDESVIEASADSLAAWRFKPSKADEAFLDEIQRGCFQYFWKEVGEPAKLAKDKTSDTVCSIAAVGFQLSSLPIGVERGWITRAAGEERALTVLRSLVERTDNKKFGIYLHFLDERSGGLPDFSRTKYRYELTASTIDHSLLQAGAMTAASYFGDEVAKLAERIAADANWPAMLDKDKKFLTMGWRSATDQGPNGPGELSTALWHWCSDEERLIYFLAVGTPTSKHSLEPAAYYRLQRVVKRHDDLPPYVVSWNGSLFTYFFAHCWIDSRHFGPDDPAAFGGDGPAVDWFENSRRATLTHRQRCIEASGEFPTLGENRWGLAPCAFRDHYLVHEVRPNNSDKDAWLGGVVPPYAAGSAIMFAPAESLAALREYRSLTGPDGKLLAWRDPDQGGYAFVDSFSLDPPYGHDENLGIDAGPMLLAIENARTGLVWRLFMEHDVAKRAVERLKLEPRRAARK